MAPPTIDEVVVHPLVLLSVVDHYNRVAKDTRKRVVGVLLGETWKGKVDVTNSYAVPFDEDERNPNIWFLDHNFHENMSSMFKKVNAKEKVVGWYHTGPKIRSNDLAVHEIFKRYNPNPTLVIIDVKPEELGIPTKAYVAVEEEKEKEKGASRMSFAHIPSSIGALEAEEVGVEHLLRDIKDTSISTLATRVQNKLIALKTLHNKLGEMGDYLDKVVAGTLPMNHDIINNIQDAFNLLPNISTEQMVSSFAVKNNDMMLAVYVSSLIRSIVALHNLINNKLANREAERKLESGEEDDDKKDKEGEKEKDGEKKKGEGKKEEKK
eukprot:TRINITY_DN7114_c0_g1_i1.p1 TRINITY_DN7114_c0_g1~~TRINITY_DN7114_c0_g1_i1.p1  ORF type:complete len:379 (-),score=142.99 TRINITY_DN7114_c0_g1_i1:87-1055(-)